MDAYTLLGIIGVLLSLGIALLLQRRTKLTISHILYLGLCAVAGMFVGGHLLFFIVGLPDFIRNDVPNIHNMTEFFDSLYYAASGMVFYGGLLCALLFMYLYIRIRKLPGRSYLNNTVITFPVFHACGRIGCTLTGCCYGIEYHGHFAIQYTEAQVSPGINDHLVDFTRFPVQPLEAFLELVIFGILLALFLKKGDRFAVTSSYLLMYSVVRFFDEFLRGDELRGFWGPLSTSQWISIAIFVVTVIYLIVKRQQLRKLTAQAM
ncbi:MAG: prolipoprotein diacylglyceryl transferase [Parasporobacterium sp.]|nr:prolipoprotein diacylglyceryl transferase [Parasporobacterium sp.]